MAVRAREIDAWREAMVQAKAALNAEAAHATHALLKASVGSSVYQAAVEESRRESLDGHLAIGEHVEYTASDRSAMGTRAMLHAISTVGNDTVYIIRLPDGTEVKTVRARLRPVGAGGHSAAGEMSVLNRNLSMRLIKGAGGEDRKAALESRLAAAGMVVRGGALVKFVLGRRQRHERFFRVEGTGMAAKLIWGASRDKSGRLLKASGVVAPTIRKEQRLSEDEFGRCFQVVLDGKVLAVMAPTKQEKLMWVNGLNAIVEGLLQPPS